MVNTTVFKTEVEPFVRLWLSERYGVDFTPDQVELTGAAPPRRSHGFDAVSVDRRVIAGINGSSGKTSGGKNPSGKIHKAYQELYFLAMAKAEHRLLVLTDPGFYEIMKRETQGRLVDGLEILYCELPIEIKEKVRSVQMAASTEVGG